MNHLELFLCGVATLMIVAGTISLMFDDGEDYEL